MGTTTYNNQWRHDTTGLAHFPLVDDNGYQYVRTEIDGVADIEITGQREDSWTGNTSSTSAQDVKNPGGSAKVQVSRIDFGFDADYTGNVVIKLGSNTIWNMTMDYKSGSQYGKNIGAGFNESASNGDKLTIQAGTIGAQTMYWNADGVTA
jgi:hypothetical protein